MTNNTTKRALISSALALALCFVMLVGTTFAWFTDEVSSDNNVIKTGKLDIELYKWVDDNDANKVAISESSAPLFGADNSTTANENSSNTLWEPGKTQTVYLSIKNNGSLDLKYTVVIEVTNIVNDLNEVLTYVITPDAHFGDLANRDAIDWTDKAQVESGINFTSAENVALTVGTEHFFALSVHMDDLAGNEYQNGNITFNIKVLAGQLASESDSFDNQYDADAIYPDGFYEIPQSDFPLAGFEIPHYDETGFKNGTIVITKESIPTGAKTIYFDMVPTNPDGNLVLSNGAQSFAYDINVEGIVDNNTAPIFVEIRLPMDYDGDVVSVYHNGTLVSDLSYNPDKHMVKFSTTSFSPFTVVYGGTATVVPGASEAPKAIVTYESQFVGSGANIEWGAYGDFQPSEGLDATLDAAFRFVAPHDESNINECAYKNWYVDFVVSLNTDLGADGATNQLFLGGNYGTFDWVGFHSRDLKVAANTEVYLLGSVTGGDERESGWTYANIATAVGGFLCGVGDVDGCLAGKTFTVKLRVTNPENLNEYIDVNTVTYTFGGNEVIDGVTVNP